MLETIAALLIRLMGFTRWAYFLRFSLALWLFPLMLVVLNMLDKTLTSGILVPEFPQEYLCVAFFLVSGGFAALISARVLLINGPERWNECPDNAERRKPTPLDWLLVNEQSDWEQLAIVVALVPTFLTGLYLVHYGVSQDVAAIDIILGLLLGTLLAGVVWYIANVWYYFTYDAPEKPAKNLSAASEPTVKLGVTAARTILYPRRWFWLTKPGQDPTRNWIENAETLLTSNRMSVLSDWFTTRILAITGQEGYAYKGRVKLYEAQIFAIVAMFVFLGHYLLIWPLAAPVPSFYMSLTALVVLLVGIVLATVVFVSGKPKLGLLPWKIGLIFGVWAFLGMTLYLYLFTSAERFPILATVLVMAISGFWTLAGIAFFVDRYRVPVFTFLLLVLLLPRLPHLSLVDGRDEHYFSTVSVDRSKADPVPSPAQILDSKLRDLGNDQPVIVVTATGGGLHASAWTAAILAGLEREFAKDTDRDQPEPFHKHVLLMSTVSGGSVGLGTYLRELHDHKFESANPGKAPDGPEEMQIAAQCSSLEAVGWGLVYYDLPKAFIPLAPYVLPLSSGDGDLDGYKSPLFKDRTWALRKGFERNEANSYCKLGWKFDLENERNLKTKNAPLSHFLSDESSLFHLTLLENLSAEKKNRESEGTDPLTLRTLLPIGQDGVPAFTMNTTSVEMGNRFLLANYQVPHYSLGAPTVYPAQSFLTSFGDCSARIPDLPLATAAQLSATFPYVSSAARAPRSANCQSVHFVDGGYYDNDGTGSAIEFLRYALAPLDGEGADEQEKTYLRSIEVRLGSSPLRILWVEIRNSGDDDGGKENTSGGDGASADPANLLGQLGAVPLGFWNAGHESVTGRTRVALMLMQKSMACQLQIHRIVFADSNSKNATGTDPLNWSLTPRQRAEVRNSADKMKDSYSEAKKWFYGVASDHDWKNAQSVGDWPCTLPDKTGAIAKK
jgi:hypothetical protein